MHTRNSVAGWKKHASIPENTEGTGNTVKSFNFVGTKFRGLTTLHMFGDTYICEFQIICNITKVNKYFGGILIHGLPYTRNTQN